MIYYSPKKNSTVFLRTDSNGTQPKYKENGKWYKENMLGNEGLAEELASVVLKHCELPKDVSFVDYKQCKIGDKGGCVSNNFLLPGERYVSVQAMYFSTHGKEIAEDVFAIKNVHERFDFVVNYVKDTTGLDISNYLKVLVNLDALIANPDRHYGNVGVIQKEDNSFRLAPIFDNGQGLSMNYQITPPLMDYDEKIEALTASTLCGSFENALTAVGTAIEIDYDSLTEDLDKYPDSVAKVFLLNQLSRYEKIFDINETKSR